MPANLDAKSRTLYHRHNPRQTHCVAASPAAAVGACESSGRTILMRRHRVGPLHAAGNAYCALNGRRASLFLWEGRCSPLDRSTRHARQLIQEHIQRDREDFPSRQHAGGRGTGFENKASTPVAILLIQYQQAATWRPPSQRCQAGGSVLCSRQSLRVPAGRKFVHDGLASCGTRTETRTKARIRRNAPSLGPSSRHVSSEASSAVQSCSPEHPGTRSAHEAASDGPRHRVRVRRSRTSQYRRPYSEVYGGVLGSIRWGRRCGMQA